MRIEDYGLVGDLQSAPLIGRNNSFEYDVKRQRQVGNFPQAFSHLTLIGAAVAIAKAGSKAAA